MIIFILFFNQISLKKSQNTRIVLAQITLNIFQQHPINGIGYGQFRKKFHHYIDKEMLGFEESEINDTFYSNNPNSPLLDNTVYKSMSESELQYIQNTQRPGPGPGYRLRAGGLPTEHSGRWPLRILYIFYIFVRWSIHGFIAFYSILYHFDSIL